MQIRYSVNSLPSSTDRRVGILFRYLLDRTGQPIAAFQIGRARRGAGYHTDRETARPCALTHQILSCMGDATPAQPRFCEVNSPLTPEGFSPATRV